jgi:hypothetical protein
VTTPRTEPKARALAARIEAVLAAQLRRVRQRFLLHGLGWSLAVLVALVLVYYLVDVALVLPSSVRVVLTIACVVALALQVRRRIVYPLRVALRRDDIAVAIERRFPELHERLISAVQLQDALARGGAEPEALRNQSAVMIEKLTEDAAAQLARVPHHDLLDTGRTARVWTACAALGIGLVATAAGRPEAFGVFLARVFGSSAAYPRLTTLYVELPESGNDLQIVREGRVAKVMMAAGADLPVLVRAEGVTPREVSLEVGGGRGMAPSVAMAVRAPGRFRHVFRRVSDDFSFHARGGDDERGDLDVVVTTVNPPQVETIRATLFAPEYTGLDPVTQSGGAIEALEGSRVELQVAPTAEVASAALVFLESGREVPLHAVAIEDDAGERRLWAGEITVQKSDRYQIRLRSPTGLENPHPGTYPIVMVSDHAPTGGILCPTDDDSAVALPEALIPLRIRAADDYGLVGARAVLEVSKVEAKGEVELLPETAAQERIRQTVVSRLFEVAKLQVPGATISVGDTVTLGVALTDNRSPEPLTTEIAGRQVHIVAPADLARRVAGQFRRIREGVDEVAETQRRLQERLHDDTEDLAEGGGNPRQALTVVQVGQARVQNRAARIHTDFMRAFNLHLFNKLEDSPHAQRVLELYESYHREHRDPEPFLPDFYDMLETERREGRLGAMPKTLDPILAMTTSASRIARVLGPEAIRALDRASVADGAASAATHLAEAARLQAQILAELTSLQQRLEEWNEFQDVIIQTRAVLDKQREVQVRTRDSVSGKESDKR